MSFPSGFSNVEEDFADQAVWGMNLPRDKHVMPWRIEDELKSLGANYIQAGLWKGSLSVMAISLPASRISPGRKLLGCCWRRSHAEPSETMINFRLEVNP
jgi:hypothetical protein